MRWQLARKVALVAVAGISLVANSALVSQYGIAPVGAVPAAVGTGLIADPGVVVFNLTAGLAVTQSITITNVAGVPNQPQTWQLHTPYVGATPAFQFVPFGTTCGEVDPTLTYLQPATLAGGATCTISVFFNAPGSLGRFEGAIVPCPPAIREREAVSSFASVSDVEKFPCGVEFVAPPPSPTTTTTTLETSSLLLSAIAPVVSPQAVPAEVSQGSISLIANVGRPPAPLTSNKSKLDFGKVKKGKSDKLNVTVKNKGATPAPVGDIEVSGKYFSLKSENCPSTLPAGARCKVKVKFKPKAKGTFTGTLGIDGLKVALKGKGK